MSLFPLIVSVKSVKYSSFMQRNSRIFFFNLPENNLSIYKLIGKNIITIHVKMIFIENEKYKIIKKLKKFIIKDTK